MRTRRGWLWLTVGVAGAVLASACGSGEADPEAAPTATTAATATTATTAVVRPEPVYVDGVPQATATPTRAPAGTTVRLEGSGFTDDSWRFGNGELWLVDQRQEGTDSLCLLIARADNDITVTADGYLSGSFVVPTNAGCQFTAGQSRSGRMRYDIAYQCADCRIGTFTVILPGQSMEEPTGTRCEGTVTFGVQNLAVDIVADGLSCEEAETFLRDHARPLQPPGGPEQIDAAGFSCRRTGLSTTRPPEADYKCVNGSQTIWFLRS